MKIVHELYNPTQTGGGWDPYVPAPGAPLPISGYVRGFIICSPAGGLSEEDAVHIDGDFLVVHEAFTAALSCLETLAEIYVRDGKLAPDWRERKADAIRTMNEQLAKERPASP